MDVVAGTRNQALSPLDKGQSSSPRSSQGESPGTSPKSGNRSNFVLMMPTATKKGVHYQKR